MGHAAIQLARWADARVVATVSSDEKANLARAAGAERVVNYRDPDAPDQIRAVAPHGIDVVIEVARRRTPASTRPSWRRTAPLLSTRANGIRELQLDVGTLMARNIRYQFVLVYTVPAAAKASPSPMSPAAVADGLLPVGADAGLPLHRFPLEHTADAHDAVEHGAVGKVLIDVS